MEYGLAGARQNLGLVGRRLCDRAEAGTIRRRMMSRHYRRRMSR